MPTSLRNTAVTHQSVTWKAASPEWGLGQKSALHRPRLWHMPQALSPHNPADPVGQEVSTAHKVQAILNA